MSANAAETEEAIAHATEAAKEMRALARFEIAKGLRKIAEVIENRKKEFAETIANESAKPISLARGEVDSRHARAARGFDRLRRVVLPRLGDLELLAEPAIGLAVASRIVEKTRRRV